MHSFKRTAWKILVFALAVSLVTAVITEPYFQNEIYHYQDQGVRDQLAGTLDVLICGSSHAYRGIVPEILDKWLDCNSYNLSTSLMTMPGRYEMLKRELDRNPVELVILDISFNSMTRNRAEEGPEGDIYQLGRYRNPLERMAYFFKNFRLEEYGRTYYDTLSRGFAAWHMLLKGEGRRGSSDKYETRGFMPGPSNPTAMVYEKDYHTQPQELSFDENCVKYMQKMVDLCRERDIPVIVISVPISQRLTLLYDGLDEIYAGCKTLCQTWQVPFYDFNLLKGKASLFPDDTAYFDVNHMSTSGAQAFTELLGSMVPQILDGTDLSHHFYSSYAAAEEAQLTYTDRPF